MNGAEYAALDDVHLPHDAKLLYIMCFRRYMNYRDGTIFYPYSRMAEDLTYEPPSRSNGARYRATVGKIRALTDRLEKAGIIKKIKNGDVRKGLAPTWFCCLATFDNSPNNGDSGLFRQNQEQQMNNTVQQHGQTQLNQGLQGEQQHSGFGALQHISDTPINQYICAQEFLLDDSARMAARSVNCPDNDNLINIYNTFINHKTHRNKHQSVDDWLADWRGWCATQNGYTRNSYERKSNTESSTGGRSVMEQLKQDAERWQ